MRAGGPRWPTTHRLRSMGCGFGVWRSPSGCSEQTEQGRDDHVITVLPEENGVNEAHGTDGVRRVMQHASGRFQVSIGKRSEHDDRQREGPQRVKGREGGMRHQGCHQAQAEQASSARVTGYEGQGGEAQNHGVPQR